MTHEPDAYFVSLGDGRYQPTEHAGSAWGDDGLHFSPVAGLLVHRMEQWHAANSHSGTVISRISLDILGHIGNAEIEIETRMIRPGRTIELMETTAVIAGRSVITARAWALSSFDTSAVEGVEFAALPEPEASPLFDATTIWPGGYIRSLEVRQAGEARPGRAAAWLTTNHELVEGEPSSPLSTLMALVDTANGVATRQRPEEWLFPNIDLTVHFFRQPVGRWVGVDTSVSFGPTGQGLTSSVLHDVAGPVGASQQILTVRPNPFGAR